ncbi:glycoside hydrolase family 3 N-terminal domain-containing protein [Dysgonomonas sp. 25]|uniref:glycoside hydrolase family 3 protein n=1 Tax=Dysgonomonas sp. 25 TaxID=2302933 RepID=UPI0013D396FA|nr:glycoside hydrolase family 3 N-terminal domain-containing protein [Dysgonomonas sp. 25]NDV70149.1 glycoside hydrolase family 3 protein [Dysgonomonas sp. 25]
MKKYIPILLLGAFSLQCTEPAKTSAEFVTVHNEGGATLGYSPSSGVSILEVDGFSFKDLNKNGELDKYEDWRLSADERAKDLASKMSVDQIAGLMLYSVHQILPAPAEGFGASTYNGKPFNESGAAPWDLTDDQKKFLKEDNLRHILIMNIQSAEVAARWNNNVQVYLEGLDWGIPGNTSSDPRHSVTTRAEFNAGGSKISEWPRELGLAATFEPEVVKQFGEVASAEYRALGITTALSPQIDLATEPRWFRFGMTFGEGTELVTDMGRAYVDGFQTSEGEDEIADGWGYKSVNAMVKHWPSGGPEESGRDAHWASGKFAVYPGKNFDEHLKPFTEGAFKLNGKTKIASAVMPYYTISYGQSPDGTNYANGFSKYIVTDLLREKYGYDEVVCTDWLITADEGKTPGDFAGKPWGVEAKTVAERHYFVIKAGVDQFGGNNDKQPVLEAYQMGVQEFGEEYMRKRFEQSAVRLLRNIFRLGLFENPYLDPAESMRVVGNEEYMKAGYEAQLKSTVLLKNKQQVLPVKERKTVYIPKTYTPATTNWWGVWSESSLDYPVDLDVVKQYYDVTTDPHKADFALVFVLNPKSEHNGYSAADRHAGGNGYIPISLQYSPYTATDARTHSIAAGDPVVDPTITDRSYKGKTSRTSNANDLEVLLRARDMMGTKPVIAVVDVTNPMIFNEFEKEMDGIIVRFGSSEQSVLDIVSGKYEPSGLLPVQMPADMSTVEKQYEDVPYDMECHRDTEGNVYNFGFGLNWQGVIKDARTERYKIR